MPQSLRLRVATANLQRGGYDYDTRQHDHGKLHTMLSTLEEPPHILFLSECTFYTAPQFFSEPLYEVLEVLDSATGFGADADGHMFTNGTYAAFISKVPNSIHVPGLFIHTDYVRRLRWYDETQRRSLANSLLAEINGHKIQLKSVHWNGSCGSTLFDQQSARDGQMARTAAIIGGDFNATSSHPRENLPADWALLCDGQGQPQKRSQKGIRQEDGSWRVYTEAIDSFLEHGWRDAGEEAEDFTPTVHPAIDGGSGLRIDRIMVSNRTPAKLVPGSYTVHVPEPGAEVSDHRMVSCSFDIGPAEEGAA